MTQITNVKREYESERVNNKFAGFVTMTSKINIDAIKNYVLVFLFSLSIILTGNLWILKSRGFSFDMGENYLPEELSEEKLLGPIEPYQVVIGDGESSHWVAHNTPDFDSNAYKKVVDIAYQLLERIFSHKKYQRAEVQPDDVWVKLISGRNFRVDFKAGIDISLFNMLWKTDLSTVQPSVSDILSVVIAPWENVEDINRFTEVYIQESTGRIVKYTVMLDESIIPELLSILEDQQKNGINYKTFYDGKIFTRKTDPFNPGILFLMPSELKKVKYYQVRFYDELSINFDSGSKLDEYGQRFFERSENDTFLGWSREEDSKRVSFTSKDAILRIYPDGFTEYFYIGSLQSNNKTKISDAYRTALTFLHNRWGDPPENTIMYLAGINKKEAETRDSYTFYFDYEVDGMPLVIGGQTDGSSKYLERLQGHSISIKVTGNKVENCFRFVKEPELLNRRVQVIDVIEAMDNLARDYDIDRIYYPVKDIFLGYDMTAVGNVDPVWVFRTSGNQDLFINAVDTE